MICIVELKDEIDELIRQLDEVDSLWIPIWKDHEKHPLNNDLSFVYIRSGGRDYIVSLNHVDALSVDKTELLRMVNTQGRKWTFQKKKFLHSIPQNCDHSKIRDLDSMYFLHTSNPISYERYMEPILREWSKLGYTDNLPNSIPILRWAEPLKRMCDDLFSYTTYQHNDFTWYDYHVIPVLNRIERTGIIVDTEKFLDRFGTHQSKHLTASSQVFTEYNPYIVTGRPSNRFGGINFGALNKTDGTRKCFIPSYKFLLMDYDAYHIRLIGKLIGYKLPKENAHGWLAEQYGTDYDTGKKLTFQLIYGGVDDEFLTIPFLYETNKWIQKMWKEVQRTGMLKTSERLIPLDWISDPSPQKVFNYLLQSLETERNVRIMDTLLDYTEQCNIKPVLYTYDSYLFDVPHTAIKSEVTTIHSILTEGGFPMKFSWGNNFDEV